MSNLPREREKKLLPWAGLHRSRPARGCPASPAAASGFSSLRTSYEKGGRRTTRRGDHGWIRRYRVAYTLWDGDLVRKLQTRSGIRAMPRPLGKARRRIRLRDSLLMTDDRRATLTAPQQFPSIGPIHKHGPLSCSYIETRPVPLQ